jgi:hypothetical protein
MLSASARLSSLPHIHNSQANLLLIEPLCPAPYCRQLLQSGTFGQIGDNHLLGNYLRQLRQHSPSSTSSSGPGFGAFGSAVASSTSSFFKKPDDKPLTEHLRLRPSVHPHLDRLQLLGARNQFLYQQRGTRNDGRNHHLGLGMLIYYVFALLIILNAFLQPTRQHVRVEQNNRPPAKPV